MYSRKRSTERKSTRPAGGDGYGSDERRLGLAAVAHVALEALALAGRVVALAAAAALERVVVGLDRLLDAREDVRVRA